MLEDTSTTIAIMIHAKMLAIVCFCEVWRFGFDFLVFMCLFAQDMQTQKEYLR